MNLVVGYELTDDVSCLDVSGGYVGDNCGVRCEVIGGYILGLYGLNVEVIGG